MRAAILVGLMLVCRSAQPAEIYRCTDPEGGVTFSQTRCAVDARRIDLPDRPPTDRDTAPETRSTHATTSDPAQIDRKRSEADPPIRREERERRERMRMMALEADRWGRKTWQNGVADEEASRSSTQQRR